MAILDAAEVEFARAGLPGARTEDIAEASGVTRAMIHYYFASKENLYQAVLERILSNRVRAIQNIDLHHPDVKKVLIDFVRSILEAQGSNVNEPNILLFEAIQNEGRYYKDIAMASTYIPLSEILKRGMDEGKFRKLDPMHAAINVMGMTVFYKCAKNNVKHLFPPGTDLLSPEMLREHTDTVIEMLINGIVVQSN